MTQRDDDAGAAPRADQGNGMAVAGLVLGICAAALCWVPFLNWLLAILGIVFGAVGLAGARRRGGAGRGLALTGLVLGIVAFVIGTILVIVSIRRIESFHRNSRSERPSLGEPASGSARAGGGAAPRRPSGPTPI